MKIKELLHSKNPEKLLDQQVEVYGWVRSIRAQKTFAFIALNDGSTLANLQIVIDESHLDFSTILETLSTGCSIQCLGKVVKSPGKGQLLEIHALKLELIGTCPVDNYPLQKKRHSFEFLRTIAHLRARTNTQGAVLRVKNALAFATHLFFQKKGFIYVQTPLITTLDCEGGGEMFRVTTLNKGVSPDCTLPFEKDFFHKSAYLTVSGQLEAESLALALSHVYTFGPTFRAENSHTSRHLAEFWMIEPEMAFTHLKENIDCAEQYLKFMIEYVFENCEEDMNFFDQFIEKDLINKLKDIQKTSFERISYTDAIHILTKAKQSFQYEVKWGLDLQTEHERFLTEIHFKKPVVVTDYPKQIKAFYMRDNEDKKTVSAMDILMPKIGELVGGSEREERYDLLKEKMKHMDLHEKDYGWYLQLREYGSVFHSGFGVGFERLVQFITGMENIRDVIPFPRYPGHAEF